MTDPKPSAGALRAELQQAAVDILHRVFYETEAAKFLSASDWDEAVKVLTDWLVARESGLAELVEAATEADRCDSAIGLCQACRNRIRAALAHVAKGEG